MNGGTLVKFENRRFIYSLLSSALIWITWSHLPKYQRMFPCLGSPKYTLEIYAMKKHFILLYGNMVPPSKGSLATAEKRWTGKNVILMLDDVSLWEKYRLARAELVERVLFTDYTESSSCWHNYISASHATLLAGMYRRYRPLTAAEVLGLRSRMQQCQIQVSYGRNWTWNPRYHIIILPIQLKGPRLFYYPRMHRTWSLIRHWLQGRFQNLDG